MEIIEKLVQLAATQIIGSLSLVKNSIAIYNTLEQQTSRNSQELQTASPANFLGTWWAPFPIALLFTWFVILVDIIMTTIASSREMMIYDT